MMHPSDHLEGLIDAVLAGEASPAQHAEHESRLREDASYRDAFETQSRLDEALRRWSAADTAPLVPVPRAPRRWKPLALAAALALVGIAAVIAWRTGLLPVGGGAGGGSGGGGGTVSPYAKLTAEGIYREAAAGKFTPAWRCEDDHQFVNAVVTKLKRPVLLPLATSGVEIIGWSYSDLSKPTVSSLTMQLYVRTASGPAVVLVDRIERDKPGGLASGGSPEYHAFRRELGGLVLYEVTKAASPEVIGAFVVPDAE